MDYKKLYAESKNLNILLVEDYTQLREDTLEILDNYFNYCEGAVDGKQGVLQYQAYHEKHKVHFDLIITDIIMPEMNGISLVEEIYKINENQSIIILSSHQESSYLLELINLGIEQFITKPIEQDQMLHSLYKVCKKINNNGFMPAECSKIFFSERSYFDRETGNFYHEEVMIRLTKNEFIFMQLISQSAERIYSNEEVVHHFAYEDVTISHENVRGLVAKLRKKLPFNCIESVYGIGYKFLAPLS